MTVPVTTGGCVDTHTPAQTRRKLMTWLHPPHPPMVVPVCNAATRPAPMPARHSENPVWLRPAKYAVFFTTHTPFAFLSQTWSPLWVTAEHLRGARACEHGVETRDMNSSCENTVEASSPCQRQIYLCLEEFVNERVKPIHISLSGDKAASHAVPYRVPNRRFSGMNK